MKIALILKDYDLKTDFSAFDYLIGVDRGAYIAMKQGIKLNIAIGDFDSINKEELNELQSFTEILKLQPKKDLTDTEYALKEAFKLSDDVTILGGIKGNRVEHLIANLNLFNKYPKLTIKDECSKIYVKDKSFKLEKSEYKFISFFAYDGTPIITLQGFKYPLTNYELKQYDSLCISNEIEDFGIVTIKNGKILVIETKNDQI